MPNDHLTLASAPTSDTTLTLQLELLQAADIACYIHRESGAAAYPLRLIPLQYLMLVHAEDLTRAKELIETWRTESAATPGADWRCEKCGENSSASFTSCWQCGADRDPW